MIRYKSSHGHTFIVLDAFIQLQYADQPHDETVFLLSGVVWGNCLPEVQILEVCKDMQMAISLHRALEKEFNLFSGLEHCPIVSFSQLMGGDS